MTCSNGQQLLNVFAAEHMLPIVRSSKGLKGTLSAGSSQGALTAAVHGVPLTKLQAASI